jgi:hypothetical protein
MRLGVTGMFDFNIAFYTSFKQTGRSRAGHLWMVDKWEQPPLYYGAPSAEFIAALAQQTEADRIESQQLDFSSKTDKEISASILASLFQKLGVVDIKASSLLKLEFSVSLTLEDYTRLSIPPAAFNPLIGQRVPPIAGTGRWVIAYAQHEASQGRFTLNYNKQKAGALGLDLAARGSASLNYEGEHAAQQAYNFKASEPVVFGMSVIQLEEKGKRWSQFGDKHKFVRFMNS